MGQVLIGPTEAANRWKALRQQEQAARKQLESEWDEQAETFSRLQTTNAGRAFLAFLEGQAKTLSRKLETMEPDEIGQARVQAVLEAYRLWTRLLTQKGPEDARP